METKDLKEKVKNIAPIATSTASGAIGGMIGTVIGGPVGGAVGGALASLLPSLASTPAAKRHQERLSSAFQDLEKKLSRDTDLLHQINDNQYKIINEGIATLSRTVDIVKVEHLKKIIVSSVSYSDYSDYDSILISRIIRDITAEEIKFLIENYSFQSVNVYSWHQEEDSSEKDLKELSDLKDRIIKEGGLLVLPNSPEAFVVHGLVNLGVLTPAELALGVHVYKYSSISAKLLALLTR